MLARIKALLGKDWTDTMDLMQSSLRSDMDLLNSTNSSIISNGGKQLRPLMSLLIARACSGGKATVDSVRFAAAAELLHNATLLHDDVVDNSDERRGKPTVMSILGGSASVLIGDFWLVKAMEIILSSEELGQRVIRIFAKTLSDLAEGEMLQLQKAFKCDTTEDDYYRVIYNKTASLFEASGVSAALSVGASDEIVQAVREYCVNLGIAFQIKDDILDYSGGDKLGKPIGIDLDERKITLPLLGALRSVGDEEAAIVREKILNICSRPESKSEIREFVFSRGGDKYAAQRLSEFVDKAVQALAPLPDSEEKDYLVQIAGFTAGRDK